MSRLRLILSLFVALAVLSPSVIFAQEEPPPEETKKEEVKEETKTEETKTEETKTEEVKLSDEQLDYIAISSTVACYNKRVTDAAKATKAIEAFLEVEGITLDEYKALEKKFRGDTAVQEGIKAEMDLCDTKVLAMPEDEPELTDDEKKELAEAEKKKEWSYAKKTYKTSISKSGVSNGRISVAFKGNGKSASGNFGGRLDGQNFSIGFSGTRSKNSLSMSGSSGKTNSGKLSITFKKKTAKDKDGNEYDHYREAEGSFSGKIHGKSVSFSFTMSSKK
ncbi:MAG: hypothetical protein RBU37_00815 [Myxococcota bacterium]|jgi:hypothetical protein|nr:hypothetical protein [Myxococcota bacterium]